LTRFREHYEDNAISKDDIFDYIYGVLHAPSYRERFANDLSKGLPRIPFARDFRAFAAAGRDLAALHLGYETCEQYSLQVEFTTASNPGRPEHYRLGKKAMKLSDDRATLIINEHMRLKGLPSQCHDYEVNGRTPLAWFIDRYRVKQDRKSGIVHDPNAWFEQPEDLIAAIRRSVHVSVETVRIVQSLPDPFDDPSHEAH